MTKPVILTGLRANNDLHIGNYFGALLPLIDMAKNRSSDFQINLFVPDLHSFTTPIDHNQLQAQILHNLKLFAAAGLPLDNEDIHIYRQSYIPAHSEITWILDCFTSFGEMRRMTQFKDKSGERQAEKDVFEVEKELEDIVRQESLLLDDDRDKLMALAASGHKDMPIQDHLNYFQRVTEIYSKFDQLAASLRNLKASVDGSTAGLFSYPVLMAADILLYDAQYVPVGDDQSQHLEFTRDIAERMNNKFGDRGLSFVVPEPVKKQHEFFGKDQGLRIKDLVEPSRKMSKSEASDRGVIFLGDSPEEAAKKIMGATTDNEGSINLDFDKQPGISNLLQISALLSGESLDAVAGKHQGQQSYGDLKTEVANQVKDFLTDFQSKLADIDEAHLMLKLQSDEAKMNDAANTKLIEVQKAVGLR